MLSRIREAVDGWLGSANDDEDNLGELSLEYSYEDLCAATDSFHPHNKLGAGAAGAVYRGVIRGGTEVAVKVLTDTEGGLNGFKEELQVLSRFRHPNLVTLLGWGRSEEDESTHYLVYELLPGGDLERRLTRCKKGKQPFPWQHRLRVALDAAKGLSHMVNGPTKAFHRDIKTPNILLDASGTAKMADFGLASIVKKVGHRHLTVEDISGTPGYACPVYIESGRVCEESEVYSFGTVLLEMLMNEPPAVAGPQEGEIFYPLVQLVQPAAPGAQERILGKMDATATWEHPYVDEFAKLALQCVDPRSQRRPSFEAIVAELRRIMQTATTADKLLMGPSFGGIPEAQAYQAGVAGAHQVPQHQQQWQQSPGHPQQLPRAMWACVAPVRAVVGGQGPPHVQPFPSRSTSPSPSKNVDEQQRQAESPAPPNQGLPMRRQSSEGAGGYCPSRSFGACADAVRVQRSSEAYVPGGGRASQRKTVPDADNHCAELVLECIHADDIDLNSLPREKRSLAFSVAGENRQTVAVGRQHQPDFFELLVRRRDCLACISRNHFELTWDAGTQTPSLRKLSSNALHVDNRPVVGADSAVSLREGSHISFSCERGAAYPNFLVLCFQARGRQAVAADALLHKPKKPTGGSFSPTKVSEGARNVAPALLECVSAHGTDLTSFPMAARVVQVQPDVALELGRQQHWAFFESLFKAEPRWLGYISRSHCKILLRSSETGGVIDNLSANVIMVDGRHLWKGQAGKIALGGTLEFLAKPSPEEGEVKFLCFTLRSISC